MSPRTEPANLDFITATQAFLEKYRSGGTVEECEAAVRDAGFVLVRADSCRVCEGWGAYCPDHKPKVQP